MGPPWAMFLVRADKCQWDILKHCVPLCFQKVPGSHLEKGSQPEKDSGWSRRPRPLLKPLWHPPFHPGQAGAATHSSLALLFSKKWNPSDFEISNSHHGLQIQPLSQPWTKITSSVRGSETGSCRPMQALED